MLPKYFIEVPVTLALQLFFEQFVDSFFTFHKYHKLLYSDVFDIISYGQLIVVYMGS